MTKFLSLVEIERQVADIATRIDIDKTDMEKHITFSTPVFGHPYIEISDEGYRYIVKERGEINVDKTTMEIQELLYWIFDSATHSIASKFALKNPYPAHWEQRRILFKKQLELMGIISQGFRDRCKKEISAILEKYPAEDGLPNNMDYEEWEDNAIVQEN